MAFIFGGGGKSNMFCIWPIWATWLAVGELNPFWCRCTGRPVENRRALVELGEVLPERSERL